MTMTRANLQTKPYTMENVARKMPRFSYNRMESVMLATKVSWDELEVITGISNLKETAKRGLSASALKDCCDYMECDPDYILMMNNDPKCGSYKPPVQAVKKPTPEKPAAVKKSTAVKKKGWKRPAKGGREENKISKERIKQLVSEQGWKQKGLLYFVQSPESMISLTSAMMSYSTLPKGTTETLAWMLGVTVPYLCGSTDKKDDGPVAKRHHTPDDTFILDVRFLATDLIRKYAGVSEDVSLWLKAEPRLVSHEMACEIARRLKLKVTDLAADVPKKDVTDGQVTGFKDAGKKLAAPAPVPLKLLKPVAEETTEPMTQEPEYKEVSDMDTILAFIDRLGNKDLENLERYISIRKELNKARAKVLAGQNRRKNNG